LIFLPFDILPILYFIIIFLVTQEKRTKNPEISQIFSRRKKKFKAGQVPQNSENQKKYHRAQFQASQQGTRFLQGLGVPPKFHDADYSPQRQ
jgi:hypothetical protein